MNDAKTEIQIVAPENEPEYVCAHATPVRDSCADYNGDYVEDLSPCTNEATHTVVMRSPSGDLSEVPLCDECGEPEDVSAHLRD